jgi:hypothetical protein
MRELKSKSRLVITFGLSIVIGTVMSFTSNNAIAGTRRCQSYSDNTSVCINEKGYKYYCQTEKGNGYNGTKQVCVGKGYRKECIPTTQWTISCLDNKGLRSKCRGDGSPVSYCEKSDGTEGKCVYYSSDSLTICTDTDKKGNPI